MLGFRVLQGPISVFERCLAMVGLEFRSLGCRFMDRL